MIQVFARDLDGEGPNGQVTYSIVSQHNKFDIDPKTGWLSTNAVSVMPGYHTIDDPLRIPLELEHKLGKSSGDPQGIPYSVTTA